MSRGTRGGRRFSVTPPELMAGLENLGQRPGIGDLESIVLKTGRPVVFVKNNSFQIDGLLIPAWRDRLEAARKKLEAVLPSIGRINVINHPTFDWLGTGWLVRPDIMVTNRHVAQEFATKTPAGGFTFLSNFRKRLMAASIDFRMEQGGEAINECPLVEVLHIEEPNPSPDMAFLRVSLQGASPGAALGRPIPLSSQAPKTGQRVAIIGYPARDSRIPDPDVIRSIFGDDYDVKRLAPGEIMRIETGILEHDASTLGGNSGSAVIDLEAGEAIGLHFAGSYLQANYAVPASVIAERLKQLGL
jgi:endonuclease G, mitochondrial